ncbi:Sodium/calcium exchanger protein-domain-containing protein [Coniochaeta sp. 2T2.1]|nr:Sodium/calcium exchanger protein-domain-containing protein [Coniochaeta sp. 2T2.1]
MKKTSPNLTYTDRFRFWTRTHGGTSPHGHGGTDGTQPVNSQDSFQPGHLHHLTHSVSQPAVSHTIDLEAQDHAFHHTHGADGSSNNVATPAAVFTPSHDAKGHPTTSEATPQRPVVNISQDNEKTEQTPGNSKPNLLVRFARTSKMILLHSKLNILLVFVPVGIAVAQVDHLAPGVVFAMNAIAIIPLAGLLSHATESVAHKLGDATGALLNVTFGNAVELIIFIALSKNEIRIVQASLIGSILANLLLILGMAFLLGGLRFREQLYNSTVTNTSVSLLSLSVSSLLLPTVFYWSFADKKLAKKQSLTISHGTSVLLLLVYGIYLLFQLKSHAYMYESTPQKLIDEESARGPMAQWLASSSSDDDSSSSSSDSDDSSHSRATISRRVRRAIRGGGRHRKSSVISSDTATIVPTPTTTRTPSFGTGDLHPRDEAGSDYIMSRPFPETNEEAIDDGGSHKSSRAKRRYRRSRRHRSKKSKKASSHHTDSRDFVPEAETISETPEVQSKEKMTSMIAGEPRRVDFAVSDAVSHAEGSSTETYNRFNGLRGISLRPVAQSLAPTLFVPTGKQPMPPSVPAGPVPRVRYGIRRTNSLPDRLNMHFHQHHPQHPNNKTAPSVQLATLTGSVNIAAAVAKDGSDLHADLSRVAAILLLLISTALVAVCADLMVDSIKGLVASSSVGEIFIGLIILPIVGNAAEHVTAITVAMKNKMDLAIGVAVGSSIQIALFVTPLIVVIGWAMGKDMSLYFTLFEFACLFVSAFIVNFLVLDGRSNYLEGALLCATYAIIGLVAFYYPNNEDASDWGGA